MDNINATDARIISKQKYVDECEAVLKDIRLKAESGETVLHIYKSLRGETINELKNRGFRIIDHPSIAIQRDDLYYSIYWNEQ